MKKSSFQNFAVKLYNFYDTITGRYRCTIAQGEEKAIAKKLIIDVFNSEYNRSHHNGKCSLDEFDSHELIYDLVICKDRHNNSKIVAALQLFKASDCASIQTVRDYFLLEDLSQDLQKKTLITFRQAIQQDYRHTVVRGLMYYYLVDYCLKKQYCLFLFVCEPYLESSYLRFGGQAFGKINNSIFGGYRVPLCFSLAHINYVRSQCHYFNKLFKKYNNYFIEDNLKHELKSLILKRKEQAEESYSLKIDDTLYQELLPSCLSKKSKASVLKNAALISCQYGDVVIRAGDSGTTVGLVVSGELAFVINDKQVGKIFSGEMFGLASLFLASKQPCTIVNCEASTTILLLSPKFVNLIDNQNERLLLWQHLSKLLLQCSPEILFILDKQRKH